MHSYSSVFLKNCKHNNYEPYFKHLYNKPSYLPLFDTYEPRLGQSSFGINSRIKLINEDDQWMTYLIEIPSMVHKSNFACMRCGGKGGKSYREKCADCKGTGRERILDYNQVEEVCYSLAVFLSALHFPIESGDTDTPYKQLFTLTSICEWKAHGHSVGGYASPEFLRFLESMSLSSNELVKLPSVTAVMRTVHKVIETELHRFDRFSCYTRRGQIILDCPGNACQIHTEPDRRFGSGTGDNIVCHNLDTGMQQLTLLSGMGELSSLYDDWIINNPKL